MKKRIIFASIVAATIFANVTAKAETVSTTKADSNKLISKNDLNKLLVNGQEKELTTYITEKVPTLANSKEFGIVNKVLNKYNNNSVAFFNLTDTEKLEFNDALLIFVKNLEEFKTKEANNWLVKIKHTSNTLNFLWSVNKEIEVQDNNQEIAIDTAVEAI